MSDTPRDRNLRAAPVHNLSPDGLAQIVSSALQAAFGDEKSGIKAVQRASNSNHRTAKNWWQGRNAPDALNLLKLMAEIPELRGEVRRLTAMHSDLNPHFEQAMVEAVRLFEQMRKP